MMSPQKLLEATHVGQNLLKIETVSSPESEGEIEESPVLAQDEEKSSDMKFACKCGKAYSLNASLFNHIRIKHNNSIHEWKVFAGMRKQGRPKKEIQINQGFGLNISEKEQTFPSEGSVTVRYLLMNNSNNNKNNNLVSSSNTKQDTLPIESSTRQEIQVQQAGFSTMNPVENVKIQMNTNFSHKQQEPLQHSITLQNQQSGSSSQQNVFSQQNNSFYQQNNQYLNFQQQQKQEHNTQTGISFQNQTLPLPYQSTSQYSPFQHPYPYVNQFSQFLPQGTQYFQKPEEQQQIMKLSDNPTKAEIIQHVTQMLKSQDHKMECNSIAMDTVIRFKDILDAHKDPLSEEEEIEHLSNLITFQFQLLSKYKINSESLGFQLLNNFPFLRFWMRYMQNDKIDETLQEYLKYQFVKTTKVQLDVTAAMERFQNIDDDFQRKNSKLQQINQRYDSQIFGNSSSDKKMTDNLNCLPVPSKEPASKLTDCTDMQFKNKPAVLLGSQTHFQAPSLPPIPYPNNASNYSQNFPQQYGFAYIMPPHCEGNFIPTHPFQVPQIQPQYGMISYPSQKEFAKLYPPQQSMNFPYPQFPFQAVPYSQPGFGNKFPNQTQLFRAKSQCFEQQHAYSIEKTKNETSSNQQ